MFTVHLQEKAKCNLTSSYWASWVSIHLQNNWRVSCRELIYRRKTSPVAVEMLAVRQRPTKVRSSSAVEIPTRYKSDLYRLKCDKYINKYKVSFWQPESFYSGPERQEIPIIVSCFFFFFFFFFLFSFEVHFSKSNFEMFWEMQGVGTLIYHFFW